MLGKSYRPLTRAVRMVCLGTLALSCSREFPVQPSPPAYTTTGLDAAPPPNDDFANATLVDALPFNGVVDITAATLEPGEPSSSCFIFVGFATRTAWYAFTPTETVWVGATHDGTGMVAAYTGTSVLDLTELDCDPFSGRVAFHAQAGTTYFVQVRDVFGQGTSVVLHLAVIAPPSNDDFAHATAMPEPLPFEQIVDVTAASLEDGEPIPTCAFGPVTRTAWYAFTPTLTTSVAVSYVNAQFSGVMATYSGTSLSTLTSLGCSAGFGGRVLLRAEAGTTYHIQVGAQFDDAGPMDIRLDVLPPPVAGIGFFPGDPSIFDAIQFVDQSFDPGGVGIEAEQWSFGDGTTGSGCCPTHQYSADADFTVQLSVSTFDGRTALNSQTLRIRTHDVVITKLAVPQAGRTGQTRRIVVDVNSKRYAETVEVQLSRSVPGGFQQFGSLTQFVPMNPKGGTTEFAFSYTFTSDDAQIGKVTFRAVAVVVGAREAFPSDNEAIALSTKVTR